MRRIFILLLGFFLTTFCIGGYFAYSLFSPLRTNGSATIRVEKGDSAKAVSTKLYTAGLITHPQTFYFYLSLAGLADKIQTGEYRFLHPVSTMQIARSLLSGVPDERSFTLIEGWTIADIAAYLEQEKITPSAEFRSQLEAARSRHEFLPRVGSLEGYLFPDTYRVFQDAASEDIVERILVNFEKKMRILQENIVRSGRSLHEVLTLASIIEQEVQKPRDRRLVADLFLRRLALGMPLQADSTVNYVTGRKDAQARFADLTVNSPYNTYKFKGLPPGPISNPGFDSIAAALSPEKNTALFFLTTPSGDVHYSSTFEEHTAKKRKYLSGK